MRDSGKHDSGIEPGCASASVGGPCSPDGLVCTLPGCEMALCSGGEWASEPLCFEEAGALPVDSGHDSGSALPLPACHWPASLTPSVPDGGILSVNPFRVLVSCGEPSVTGGEACAPDAGTVCPGVDAASCHMACKPDQYILETGFCSSEYPPPFCQDVMVIQVPEPAGCTSTLPGFSFPANSVGPNFTCCPCE